MPPAYVAVLTKEPRPGRVKTRLIPALGAEGAAALHRAMAAETLWRVRRSGLPAVVALDGDPSGSFAAALRRAGFAVRPQGEGDLGERLRRAMAGPGRAIAIGTDLPTLRPEWLRQAATHPAPVVLGPARDGGYWLIAAEDPPEALFAGIPWSTSAVLALTRQRAAGLGLPVHLLPEAADVDEPADLERLLEDPLCPPAIRQELRRLLR